MELLNRDPGVGGDDGWLTDAMPCRAAPCDSSRLSELPESGRQALDLDLWCSGCLPLSLLCVHGHVRKQW